MRRLNFFRRYSFFSSFRGPRDVKPSIPLRSSFIQCQRSIQEYSQSHSASVPLLKPWENPDTATAIFNYFSRPEPPQPMSIFSLHQQQEANHSTSLKFLHGSAGYPKRRTIPALPRDTPLAYSIGEDAYFKRADAIGVSDGVGGWVGTKNANSSLFSRKLMHYANAELARYDDIDDDLFEHWNEVKPEKILEKSFELTVGDFQLEGLVGSATASLAVLRRDELRVAHLGDCGLTIIRDQDFLFRSEEQQHSFNCPYQLGTHPTSDRPNDAESYRIRVQRGDIVILGSDGLFDNLQDEEILEVVVAMQNSNLGYASKNSYLSLTMASFPQKIADILAKRAKEVSEDPRAMDTPFGSRAVRGGFYHQGGKPDDITVLCAVIGDLEDSPDRRWLDY